MKVTIDLNESEFSKTSEELIRENLRLESDDDLQPVVSKITKSALLEYLNMFIENGMSHSADEVRQDRLYFLIQNYYLDRIPCESEISSTFQLTNSQSKTLLRNTISRYRNKIERQIHNSLHAVLKNAEMNPDTDKYEMIAESEVFIEELNLIVAQNYPMLASIRKKRGCAAKYDVKPDTYNKMKMQLRPYESN